MASAIRVVRTKRGDKMAFVTLEDETGSVECVFFSDAWEASNRNVRDDQPAIIKGKAEFGGGWLCWGKKDGCNSKFKDGDPAIEEQKVGDVLNPDPFDQENTFVKMAAKRAYMDAVLRGTSTHGLFTQDLEDIAEVREPVRVKTVSFDDVDGLHELVKTKTKSKSWEETLKGCKIEAPKGWKEPDGIEQARVLMSWLSVQQADTIRNTILKYKERS
jgi:predicted RNA-binding protein with RPS1 domain